MPEPIITTVVFDLGGVLIDWDPRHLYRQLFSDPQEMEVFLRDVLAGPFDGTVDILREVRDQGLAIYALTNWSAETFPRARGMFPFLEWFRGIVVSGDERVKKPDPEIWHRLIARYAIEPGHTVYIDDMPRNAEVAAALGFHAIRFEDPVQLRGRLVGLGVLPV